MRQGRFVFLDERGKRWHRVRGAALAFAIFLFLAVVLFIRALLIEPTLSLHATFDAAVKRLTASVTAQEALKLPEPPPAWLTERKLKRPPHKLPAAEARRRDDRVVLAYYSPDDPRSMTSLRQNWRHITHVAVDWFQVKEVTYDLVASPDEELKEFADSAGIKLMPLLSNIDGDLRQPEAIETLARETKEAQGQFVANLVAMLTDIDAGGLILDWEELDPTLHAEITQLISLLSKVLHEEEMELWLQVPAGADMKVFDLEPLSAVIDHFVALIFYENGEEDAPGPIASQAWWDQWLEVFLADTDAEKWIAGIGAFGYDWAEGRRGEVISFGDAMERARLAGVNELNGEDWYHPHFHYSDAGLAHSIWFLDAITFRNQYRHANDDGCGGIALYRLGTEDPAIWKLIDAPDSAPAALESITENTAITHVGDGDFLSALTLSGEGSRAVTLDEDGRWRAAYETYPGGPVVTHCCQADPEKIAITFDDGPDERWTPQILDILKQEGVKATFFVLGSNVIKYPSLVKRMVEEGHLVGNHTYWHPDLSRTPESWLLLELSATKRLIEVLTGRSSVLFRPPYDADRSPDTVQLFNKLSAIQALGYQTVTESIDSEDWNAESAGQIVSRIRQQRKEGNVLLFHDGGGDRSITVAALPEVIRYLRMRGDEIVSLEAMAGTDLNTFMPPLSKDSETGSALFAQTGLESIQFSEQLIWAFMLTVTIIVLFRSALVVLFALKHLHAGRSASSLVRAQSKPLSVTAIIAAYNEAQVIESTIRSVLQTDYDGEIELLVVDDGSKDETAAVVQQLADNDSRIRLIKQSNHGKAHALNVAIESAKNEILVMLDADTQFSRRTIPALIEPFADGRVAAVSGCARVGNVKNWLTRFQSLEYLCSFNLDRRAYDALDCITVVPGAVSALKRSAVLAAGGMAEDTLAEDTDLTLQLHRLGYQVRYAAEAVAWTEAPETIRALLKQRVRWAFGTLQCLWKHRSLVFHPGFGALAFFSLPSMWFCQLFLAAVIPFVDALLFLSLSTGGGMALVWYGFFFLMSELLMAAAACKMEREPVRNALWAVPMRFAYRPLIAFVVWVSILRALKGAWVGWGKLERKGSVQTIQEDQPIFGVNPDKGVE